MKRIISFIVGSAFLFNNIAYGLSPAPASLNPETQAEVYTAARASLAAGMSSDRARLIDAIDRQI